MSNLTDDDITTIIQLNFIPLVLDFDPIFGPLDRQRPIGFVPANYCLLNGHKVLSTITVFVDCYGLTTDKNAANSLLERSSVGLHSTKTKKWNTNKQYMDQ